MFNTSQYSDFLGIGVFVAILGICLFLIAIIVFFQFLRMMENIKQIRKLLEKWDTEPLSLKSPTGQVDNIDPEVKELTDKLSS